MKLIGMVDSLFRDRESLYQLAAEGKHLKGLFGRLMLVFVLSSALYGLGMGSYRLFHPQFFFSDFEIRPPSQIASPAAGSEPASPLTGQVAGLNATTRTVYTRPLTTSLPPAAEIRFNVSKPSEYVPVISSTVDGGYTAIVLGGAAPLQETAAWQLPLMVAVKTPLLFVLTLLVCAPALYALNLAFGLRLHFMPVMTLMSFALAATGAMLAVFVPISAMFSVVTANYHFMKLIHLGVFAVAGLFGVKVLLEGLTKLAPPDQRSIRPLMASWLLLYCIVGGQIAWSLKPFLGTPYLPATPPFRADEGNIYVSALRSVPQMIDAD